MKHDNNRFINSIFTILLIALSCSVLSFSVNAEEKLNQNDSLKNSIELLPKDTLLINSISSAFQEELIETNDLLKEIDKKVTPKSFLNRMANELPNNIIWEFIIKSFFLWIIGIISSLSIVSKIGVVFRLKKKRRRGETDKVAEKANSIINGVSFVLLGFFLFVLILFGVQQPSLGSSNISPEIVERLSKIEELLSSFQAEPINQYINFNPLLLLITLSCLVGFFVMLFSNSKSNSFNYKINNNSFDPQKSIYTTQNFIIPVFLSLILLILPYPVDSLILPFILSYFIIALFELVKIYPNKVLLAIITRRYSLIIFLAYFGVWRSFFYAIQMFADPFWSAFEIAIRDKYQYDWLSYVRLGWRYFPYLFAIFSALPSWIKVRNAVSGDTISSLKEVLDNQENNNENN